MTRFQILTREGPNKGWLPNGIEEAHNAEAAVKAAYLKHPRPEITSMAAIPLRSWKPTPIRTETVTKVVLGDAPDAGDAPVAPRGKDAIGA